MSTPEINKPLYRNINGEKVKINPLTKSSCVIMEDGRTVEEVVNELRQLIMGGQALEAVALADESKARTVSTEEEVDEAPVQKKRGRKKKEANE